MSAEAKINIETFKAVTKAIARSRNLDIMTNHLTQLLVAALDIKGCAIYFLNPETRELEMLASFGLSTNYLTKGPILADKSRGSTITKFGIPPSKTSIPYTCWLRMLGLL
jgi:signal transduction protein with GAF and PtsI domain